MKDLGLGKIGKALGNIGNVAESFTNLAGEVGISDFKLPKLDTASISASVGAAAPLVASALGAPSVAPSLDTISDWSRELSFSKLFSGGFFNGPNPSEQQVNDRTGQVLNFLSGQLAEIAGLKDRGATQGLDEKGSVDLMGFGYDVATSETAPSRTRDVAGKLEKALEAFNAASKAVKADPSDPEAQSELQAAAKDYANVFLLATGAAKENDGIMKVLKNHLEDIAANPATTPSGSPARSDSARDQVMAVVEAAAKLLQLDPPGSDGLYPASAMCQIAQLLPQEAKLDHIAAMSEELTAQLGEADRTIGGIKARLEAMKDDPTASPQERKQLQAALAGLMKTSETLQALGSSIGSDASIAFAGSGPESRVDRMNSEAKTNATFARLFQATSGAERTLNTASGLLGGGSSTTIEK